MRSTIFAVLALAAGDSDQARVKVSVLQAPAGAREPQVAVQSRFVTVDHGFGPTNEGTNANVYVVCGTPNSILLSISKDKGEGFSPAKSIATVGTLALGMRRGPRVAVAGEAVIVTAIAGELGGGKDGDLLCWRSADEGQTWSDAHKVNETAGAAREGLHALASGPATDVFTAWIDLASG